MKLQNKRSLTLILNFQDFRGKGYGRYFMSLLEDLIRTDLDKDNFGIAVKKTDEVTKNKHKNNDKCLVIIHILKYPISTF